MTTHKTSTAGDLTNAPLAAKVGWVADRYMRNARDDAFQDFLREILVVGEDGAIHPEPVRDPLNGETGALGVFGGSGAGKSVLISKTFERLPFLQRMRDGESGNYIQITVPPEPTIRGLGAAIAAETGYTKFAKRTRVWEVFDVVAHRLAERGVAVILVDEIHHLLRAGPGRDRIGTLQMLKTLLQGRGAVALVLSGIREAEEAISKDSEMSRRLFRYHLEAARLQGDDTERLATFTSRCCERVGVQPPDDPHFAKRLVLASNGELGQAIRLMKMILRRVLISGGSALTIGEAARYFEMREQMRGALHPFVSADWEVLHRDLTAHGWGA